MLRQDVVDAGPCHLHRGFEDGLGFVQDRRLQGEQGKKWGSERWDGTLREVCGFGRSKAKLFSLCCKVNWSYEFGAE